MGGSAFGTDLDRSDLALIERAIRKGWNVPEAVRDSLPAVVLSILNSEESEERNRLRAAEILAALTKDNREAVFELIKTRRLVNGESTENTAVTFRFADGVDPRAI